MYYPWAKAYTPVCSMKSTNCSRHKLSLSLRGATWAPGPSFNCLQNVSICMPQGQTQSHYLPTQTSSCLYIYCLHQWQQPVGTKPGSHSYCLMFPYLCVPNTCVYTHTHTHTHVCTCAPHVISQEAFIIALRCPIWQLLTIYRYLKCNWSKFDMCYRYEIHTGF